MATQTELPYRSAKRCNEFSEFEQAKKSRTTYKIDRNYAARNRLEHRQQWIRTRARLDLDRHRVNNTYRTTVEQKHSCAYGRIADEFRKRSRNEVFAHVVRNHVKHVIPKHSATISKHSQINTTRTTKKKTYAMRRVMFRSLHDAAASNAFDIATPRTYHTAARGEGGRARFESLNAHLPSVIHSLALAYRLAPERNTILCRHK